MLKKIVIIIALFYSLFNFSQNEEFNLIELDTTWGKEVIRFPARNMDYIGVGEIRFPPKGWIKPNHPNFWSYTYAWKINVTRKIKSKEMALNLVKYFNSLNNIEMDDIKNPKKTSARIRKKYMEKTNTFFNGKVTIYDRFATKKRLTLYVKIKSHFSKKLKKTILLFKFSPKKFNHKTWKMLDKIMLLKEYSNN